MKQKENSWNKEQAIRDQKIELQDLQIKEYKSREENFKKMNETFMETLSGLSNESSKNKSMKDMKGLLENMNSDSEINKIKRLDLIQKLEVENRALKDQQHERSLYLDRIVAEHDKLASEQETLISSLTEQVKQILAASKATEDDERAIKAQLIAEHQRQIEYLNREIEQVRTDCAVEISTLTSLNEQRIQQIKQLYEKQERPMPTKQELQIQDINIIDEIQQLHRNEINKLQDQIEFLQESSQNQEQNSKKNIEELEQRLLEVTEKLKSFKQKNISNEQNIKLMKEKFQRQEMDIDELDSLKEQVKKLKQKNMSLLAEIRQQDSLEIKLKEQLLEQTCLIEDERLVNPRKQSVSKATTLESSGIIPTQTSQGVSLSGTGLIIRQEDYLINRQLNEMEHPNNTTVSERGYHTQPTDISTGITPRQHFKSVSDSQSTQQFGDFYDRGMLFNSEMVEPEELLKRARHQTNNRQIISSQNNIQKNKSQAGTIIQKGINLNSTSPKDGRNLCNNEQSIQQQPTLSQRSQQLNKQPHLIGENSQVNTSQQFSTQKTGLVPPLSGSIIRSASISQLSNNFCQANVSGSVSNRGGQQGDKFNQVGHMHIPEPDQQKLNAIIAPRSYCDNCCSSTNMAQTSQFNQMQPSKTLNSSSIVQQQNLLAYDTQAYDPQIIDIAHLKQITEDLSRQLEQSVFENNNLHSANETLSNQLRLITSENENLFNKTQTLILEIDHLNTLIAQTDMDRRKKEENEVLLKQEIKYLVDLLLKEKEKQEISRGQTNNQNHLTSQRIEGTGNNISRSFSRVSTGIHNQNNQQSSPSLKIDKTRPNIDQSHPCRDGLDDFEQLPQQSVNSKPQAMFTSSVNISQMFNSQNCVNQSLCLNGSTKSPGFLNFIHQNKENSSFQSRKGVNYSSVGRSNSSMSSRNDRMDQRATEEADTMMMGNQSMKQKRESIPTQDQGSLFSNYNSVPINSQNQNAYINMNISPEIPMNKMDRLSSHSNLKTGISDKEIPRQQKPQKLPSNNLKNMIQKEEERSYYQRPKTPFSSRLNSSVDRQSEQSLYENLAKRELFSQDQLKPQKNVTMLAMKLEIPRSRQEILFE